MIIVTMGCFCVVGFIESLIKHTMNVSVCVTMYYNGRHNVTVIEIRVLFVLLSAGIYIRETPGLLQPQGFNHTFFKRNVCNIKMVANSDNVYHK